MYFLAHGHDDMLTPDRRRRFERVRLAQEFGWTFDYIDAMPEQDKRDVFAVIDGQEKARKK